MKTTAAEAMPLLLLAHLERQAPADPSAAAQAALAAVTVGCDLPTAATADQWWADLTRELLEELALTAETWHAVKSTLLREALHHDADGLASHAEMTDVCRRLLAQGAEEDIGARRAIGQLTALSNGGFMLMFAAAVADVAAADPGFARCPERHEDYVAAARAALKEGPIT
ncbi:hypothetical protein GKE82_23925 [Conexibacter sp. W3-3-2]|uniref:hypothetical protein n=1 Tax=Conexibacter sp. W3-3-2 TaxID=2675227 RepID=UPI0012B9C369|nr:hypothetical protein [Conexibacter sp. W3-3-2]MTD47256.1 hypothetical protein [Conexibacter sp. W3-3-2]